MTRLGGVLLSSAVALAACALNSEGVPQTSGPLPASSGAGGGGDAAGGTGAGGGACAGGLVCAPSAGDGELVLVLGAATACPSGWGSPTSYATATTNPGCSPCTCGMPTGTCEAGDVTVYDSGCSGSSEKFTSPNDGECFEPNNSSNGMDSISALAATASDGTCAPAATTKLPVGKTACRLDAAAAACATDGSCVPGGGAGDAICIVLPTEAACPAGYSSPQAVHEVGDDTRTCDCKCGQGPKGTCTGAAVDVFGSQGCSGASAATYNDAQCHSTESVLNDIVSLKVSAGAWTGPACPPEPHDTGDVKFGPPLTLCCAE